MVWICQDKYSWLNDAIKYNRRCGENMEQIKACAECGCKEWEHDRMVIAVGQAGVEPKEIVVASCAECGEQVVVSS